MVAFVLVSGPFTGGWVWQEVVGRLREAGAEAYGVTLTGMGDDGPGGPGGHDDPDRPGGPDGPDGPGRSGPVDLETHIADVLRVVDGAEAAEVVLVGHDYGIHPVLGAADRRPERCARVVYMDAGMPVDGDAAKALVPDRAAVERAERAERTGADAHLPAPVGEEWERWGSTAGLSAEDLALLGRLARPQPVRTLTQPLRLTRSPFDRPTTGVLCTANGSGISMVEMLVTSGPPQFRVLADPKVGFFELATGHWPMLSAPGPLAEVLLRAAADEGRRLTAPCTAPAAHEGTFLLDPPERPRERRGRVDLHLPEGLDAPGSEGPRPAVLFVHGGPIAPDQVPGPRDTPTFLGYGRLAAGLGVIGATVEHRLHGPADFPRSAEDLSEALDLVRSDPRVDADRIALWFFSAGGLLSADWLAAPPPWLRCVALTYPALAPLPEWRSVDARFRPARTVGAASPPVVLTRAGREHPALRSTVDAFLAAATAAGAPVELVEAPGARHGFETLDHTPATRAAVRQAARSVVSRLMT
ncbi:dienelactone hydrolase family protein [Streptomyces sp. NPDC053493]|uniref:dienelactone hydrolase family protein n=1 Tax=Streptomyces sp. NPDC053493 TaxID=3365705 RepID=UPI0037D1DEB2